MTFKNLLIPIIALAALLTACEDNSIISPVPQIEFVSIAPMSANNFDSVHIVISYQDGDGDLGENSPGVKNLFVTDSRNAVTYEFRVQELAPAGSNIAIQGNLNIYINAVSVIDTAATSEQVSYSVQMVDRAGNPSNTITTDPITVTR